MQTFRDFMESTLYAPGRGYYQACDPRRDFYTAPELHPAFAGLLADEIAARLNALEAGGVPGPRFIVEMGSGDGTLGCDLARSLRERRPDLAERIVFALVERCDARLAGGVLRVAQTGVKTLGYARLEDLPRCSGVFYSNELVDAFPVHLLEKRGGRMFEVYVREEGGEASECLGELSSPELAPCAESVHPFLQEGERRAVNLEALRWIRTVSDRLAQGWLITIDYGKRFGAAGSNPPRSFYRHATETENLTARPGRQDLTSSVDFDALISEGSRCGLRCVEYAPLGRFLLERGILDRMPPDSVEFDMESYKERNRLKTLFHPEGMGEAFKVLIQETRR